MRTYKTWLGWVGQKNGKKKDLPLADVYRVLERPLVLRLCETFRPQPFHLRLPLLGYLPTHTLLVGG